MLWSFASVIPLPPSFVAAPVVVTHPAMRPDASQYPSGAGSRSGPRSRSSSPGRRRSDRSVSVVLALSPWSAPFRNEEGLPFPGGLQNFLFFLVRSESLPSRPHARPLNEDDDDDADKKVAAHYVLSERVPDRPRQVVSV